MRGATLESVEAFAAARALAELAREDVVDLLPKPIDPRILVRESAAVARQTITEGVARRPLESKATTRASPSASAPDETRCRG